MYKSLFMANEILQGCLVHVRKLCESASGSLTGLGEGEHAISLVSLDKSQTLTLEDFMSIQAQQGDKALKQLNALRDKIINLVWESCAVSWSSFRICTKERNLLQISFEGIQYTCRQKDEFSGKRHIIEL